MDPSAQLYLVSGLGAVAVGLAVLVREPGRTRHRLFALLCLALATWTIGIALRRTLGPRPGLLDHVHLLGSCLAAPLGLHFALALSGAEMRHRRWLVLAYAACLLFWLSLPLGVPRDSWRVAAVVVLGSVLVSALATLVRGALSRPHGPARRVHGIVAFAGLIVATLGLTDFLPLDRDVVPRLGPVGVLAFLLIVSATLVRHRFLDVDRVVAGALAILLGAALATPLVLLLLRATDGSAVVTFATLALLLAVAGPVGRLLLSGTRALVGGEDTAARALVDASRRIAAATEPNELWTALETISRELPGDVVVTVHAARTEDAPPGSAGSDRPDRYRRLGPASGGTWLEGEVAGEAALPRLLLRDRAPVTADFLDVERREARGREADLAAEAREEMLGSSLALVVPLLAGPRLAGWIGLGGSGAPALVTADVAAGLLALGNQAVATLDRLEAQGRARRSEALAAVGEMAAGLAHEVRNPLGAIRGAAQVLAGGPDAGTSSEMLQVIDEETARLGRVVGEFLEWARPDSPRREPVDLAALVRDVAKTEALAGGALAVEVKAESPVLALGDPDQLRRAVRNLVRNAREATGGRGTLTVAIVASPGGWLQATFADDGPGIPAEQLAKLFRPFQSTKQGGTGLGLALVHRVLESHGGTIRADTGVDHGARFTLLLPAAPGPPG